MNLKKIIEWTSSARLSSKATEILGITLAEFQILAPKKDF